MRPFWQRWTLMTGLLLLLPIGPIARGQAPAPASGDKPAPELPRQTPAPGTPPRVDAATAKQFEQPQTKPYIDLTHRYRFTEQYTKLEERAVSGAIGQYQVGILEILSDKVDTPEGKPRETELTRQTIFTERPADVSSLGVVNATVRSYSRFQIRPEDVAKTAGPKPLEGLTIFYRPRMGDTPEILSLSQDRRIREREYEIASRQIFVPSLGTVFPSYPARVGDSWRVAKRSAQALLGEPSIKGDNLTARFAELKQVENSKKLIAVINVSGRVANINAETVVNASIEFAFEPPGPPKADPTEPATKAAAPASTPASVKPGEDSVIEAKGAITELRLARIATGLLPDSTRRLTFKAQQQLIVRRKFGVEETGGVLLKLFDAPPATDVNTWITYTDPSNRFLFNHPQDLLPPERFQLSGTASDDSIVLVKNRPDGKEMIRLDVFQKALEPEALQDVLNAEWKRLRAEVLPGPAEWLPETDFSAPMKVYRIESALKLGARGARLHYDAYLVKVSDNVSLMIIGTTTREGVEKFRKEIESLIKSFKLVAPKAS